MNEKIICSKQKTTLNHVKFGTRYNYVTQRFISSLLYVLTFLYCFKFVRKLSNYSHEIKIIYFDQKKDQAFVKMQPSKDLREHFSIFKNDLGSFQMPLLYECCKNIFGRLVQCWMHRKALQLGCVGILLGQEPIHVTTVSIRYECRLKHRQSLVSSRRRIFYNMFQSILLWNFNSNIL